MNRSRWVAAAVYVVVCTTLLAWWIKGDLEMGWLLGGPLLVAGAALFGVSTVVLFRRLIPVLIATGCSVVVGLICAVIAIQTPNGWPLYSPPGMVRAAEAFSNNRALVESAVTRVTGLPVELMETKVEYRKGWVSKEGFSFRLRRRPAAAEVIASFAAGPLDSVTFDIVEQRGEWLPVARPVPNATQTNLRQPAFVRRFSASNLIEVGGQGPHAPGALLLVLAARKATDWEFVLFRVAANGKPLEEVERHSQAEISTGFARETVARGLGPPAKIFIHYQPSGSYPVLFLNAPEFRFFGTLNHPAYRSVSLLARLENGQVKYEVERPFPR